MNQITSNQPIIQSTNQPFNQSTNLPIKKSITQSINHASNQAFAVPTFAQTPTPNLPIKLSLVLSVLTTV